MLVMWYHANMDLHVQMNQLALRYLEVCFFIFLYIANNGILQDIEDQEMKIKKFDYSSYDSPYRPKETLVGWERSAEQKGEGFSPGLADTLRSLKKKVVSCKIENEQLIEAKEIISIY